MAIRVILTSIKVEISLSTLSLIGLLKLRRLKMGICYTLITMNEGYERNGIADTFAEKAKANEIFYYCDKLTSWENGGTWCVFDTDKRSPFSEDAQRLIYDHFDKAWYYPDSAPWDLQEVERPKKSSYQVAFDYHADAVKQQEINDRIINENISLRK